MGSFMQHFQTMFNHADELQSIDASASHDEKLAKLNSLLPVVLTSIERHLDDPVRLDALLQLHSRLLSSIEQLQSLSSAVDPLLQPPISPMRLLGATPTGSALSPAGDSDGEGGEQHDSDSESDSDWVIVDASTQKPPLPAAVVRALSPNTSSPSSSPSRSTHGGSIVDDGEERGECPICWETRGIQRLECGHGFCRGCLAAFLGEKIEMGEVAEIKCPSCEGSVQFHEIQRLVGHDTFERYQHFSLLSFVRSTPNARWCPHASCDNILLVAEDPETPPHREQCPKCQQAVCGTCGLKDHSADGRSCAAAKAAETEDGKTTRMLRRMGAQACPHCGMMIVRTTGCRQMSCQGCSKSWQWRSDEEETWVEKGAFFYPRAIKYVATSNEAHEEGLGTQILAGIFTAAIGLPALPITLLLGLPAILIYGGRSAKRHIEDLVEDYKESRQRPTESATFSSATTSSSTSTSSIPP
ncbi:MAG: IBR domain-containing protein [archaeon]|nr:IBR domain-containing protein [archaeon]